MSAQVTITQLPSAGALTGTENVPIVQNGVTVQTTTGAIAGAGALNYPFLTTGSTSGLTQARALTAGTGLSLTDGGAGTTLQVNMTGAAAALNAASTGLLVKTGTNTIANVTLSVGSGMTIVNADGVAGNPLISLNTNLQNLSSLSGTGLVTVNGSTFSQITITGASGQISVANGNTVPVIGIASDPVVPGTGGMILPVGTTGQRGTSSNGNLRYNTTTATFEGYANGAWGSIVSGAGVSSISFGSTGLTPATSTTGIVTVAGTLAVASGGTGATTAAGARTNLTAAASGANTDITSVTLTTGTISTTPSAATDIANKTYVDTVAQGLDTKASVVAGTTANITLSGAQTIDGISIVATDRVLVKNQTAPAENGIYVASATAWARASDMSTWTQVPGAYVFIETGTTLADTGWVCTSDAGGTINVTAMTWSQFSGAGSGVSSITFGTTGLTPSTTTTGAVTVAGTLAVANGGTGAVNATDARTNLVAAKSGTNSDITELYALNGTSYGVAYQNAGNQLIMGTALVFDGTMLYVPGGISGGTF